MSHLPVPATLLPMLEALLNRFVQQARQEKQLRVEKVALHPEKVVLELRVPPLAGIGEGLYRLELVVRKSTLAATVCAPRWGRPDGVARLAGLGARLIPRALLNRALERLYGEGLRVEGEELVFEHGPLLRRLAQTR